MKHTSPSPVENIVYKGPLLTVHQWQQPLRDGSFIPFERCFRPDTVAVIAFLDAKTILLNEEHPLDQAEAFFDVPGGRVDEGESGEHAAARELREETDYQADELMLWDTNEYKGLITFRHLIYVAKGLRRVEASSNASHDPTENIIKRTAPFEEAYQRSLRGELRRSEVMLALLRMKHDEASRERLAAFLSSL